MNVRIQFIGLVGSGKSFLAKKINEKLCGYIIPFAKKVYELAEIAKGSPINKSLPEDRELLKLIGTTWGRESKNVPLKIQDVLEPHKPNQWGSPDIWAKIFIEECLSLSGKVPILNDDTRFENELRIAGEIGGFVPIFVSCTETVRLSRLFGRGDNKDPNDKKHQSEILVNRINKVVLNQNIMPVVWNDDNNSKPDETWILQKDKFIDLVINCDDNNKLRKALEWDEFKLKKLLAFAQDNRIEPINSKLKKAAYNL